MGAIIYHGVVYHPACVAPTTKRQPATAVADTTSERPRPA